MQNVQIIRADYNDPRHGADLIAMLDVYAHDPMGGGTALPQTTKDNLLAGLAAHVHAFSFLAYDGETPIGLANCFEGFSTFKARPLVNIHDIAVHADYRGQGVGQALLAAVENEAIQRGACKITLEVLSGNKTAQRSYMKFGFEGYALDPEAGHALFWEKAL